MKVFEVLKTPEPAWVMCDAHGEIHEKRIDVYQEGPEIGCEPANWRAVFIESVMSANTRRRRGRR